MHIDWLTVVAQIINFLVLVWLLKRFLYRPVINAMDQREQRIAERLQSAEQREQDALETRHSYESSIAQLDQDRDTLREQTRLEVEEERRQLLDQARSEAAEKRAHWQHQVAEEEQHFLRSLQIQAAESIQTVSRRALTDLADVELEEQIIHTFVHRLRSLDRESRDAIATAAEPVTITTSFEMDSVLRGRVTRAIHELIGKDVEIVYGVAEDLLCGIELKVSGRRLSWTLDEYLQDLSLRMQKMMETRSVGYD